MDGTAEPEAGTETETVTPRSVFGTDDRVRIGDTTGFPYASIGKITVHGQDTTATATGFMIGPNHMVTAGHVAFNDAYGGDGWAQEMTVDFGKGFDTDLHLSAGMADVRALPDWIDSGAASADLALVTLDRSIGDLTQWFDTFTIALPDFFDDSTVNIAGYPGDIDGGHTQVLSTGQIGDGTSDQLFYGDSLDTGPGMSGAPIWQYFRSTGERQVIGVHTSGTSDPTAPGAVNSGVRLTAEILTLFDEWMDSDAALNPPVDLPDLVDHDTQFGTRLSDLSADTVTAADIFTVSAVIRNAGTAVSSAAEVRVLLSANDEITEIDIPLGTAVLDPLSPLEHRAVEITGSVPSGLTPGTYNVGWLIDPGASIAEFEEGNNTGLLSRTLTVNGIGNLTIPTLNPASVAWYPNTTVGVDWTLRNAGTAEVASAESALFLSVDQTVTSADTRLLVDPASDVLAPGVTRTEGDPGSFTVPAGLAPGTYWIAAIADTADTLREGDETDNRSAVIEVTVGNRAPVAVADAATLAAGGSTDIAVLANDSDPDGHALGIAAIAPATSGTATVKGDVIRYTPDIGFAGIETLSYTLADPYGGVTTGTVEISVTVPGIVLTGGATPDLLVGSGDDDAIDGGGGADRLLGGGGRDGLAGGDDADLLIGGSGDDALDGGAGDDTLHAGDGDDTLSGGDGADLLFGHAGADILRGGAGNDRLDGGAGADALAGGDGSDTLLGGAGSDDLRGGKGADRLMGGAGNDTLEGGAGADYLHGGDGADVFVFDSGHGPDLVADFDPELDLVAFAGGPTDPTDLTISEHPRGGTAITFSAEPLDVIHLIGIFPADLDPELHFAFA